MLRCTEGGQSLVQAAGPRAGVAGPGKDVSLVSTGLEMGTDWGAVTPGKLSEDFLSYSDQHSPFSTGYRCNQGGPGGVDYLSGSAFCLAASG